MISPAMKRAAAASGSPASRASCRRGFRKPFCRWSRRISISSGPSIRSAILQAYPGSPLIARALLRPQDRLVACEVEPKARKRLIDALRRDTQARVVDLDGWVALPAFVPPKERRGLVLIDPSFEQKDEFERLADGFAQAFAKWPTGSYLLWYPVKSRRATDSLARHVAAAVASGKRPRQMPAAGVQRGAAAGRRRADIGRASDRQSAVAACGRTQGDPARAGKAARPGRRRPVQARGAQSLSATGRTAQRKVP